jgi:hypothetical protein
MAKKCGLNKYHRNKFIFQFITKKHWMQVINCVGWMLATCVAIAVVYGLYTPDGSTDKLNTDMSALYNATSRIAWSLSVAWVILSCASGYGGKVIYILQFSFCYRSLWTLTHLRICYLLLYWLSFESYLYYKGHSFWLWINFGTSRHRSKTIDTDLP